MFEGGTKSAKTARSGYRARILRISALLVLSAASASATPLSDIRPARTAVSVPRTYCLANVASLGTGLLRDPAPSEIKSLSYGSNLWTGWIRASASGKYEIFLAERPGQIFVNKQKVFSRSALSSKPAVIQIELLTNRYYAITVETPRSEDSILPLQWQRPDGRQELVPKAYLYAPVATVGTI